MPPKRCLYRYECTEESQQYYGLFDLTVKHFTRNIIITKNNVIIIHGL